jgi:hypothetical protein
VPKTKYKVTMPLLPWQFRLESLAVKDVLTTYPIGTFAGFNISNPNLINANLLSGITLKTYKAGVLQESLLQVVCFL